MFDILCRCVIYMQYTYMSVYIYIYIYTSQDREEVLFQSNKIVSTKCS